MSIERLRNLEKRLRAKAERVAAGPNRDFYIGSAETVDGIIRDLEGNFNLDERHFEQVIDMLEGSLDRHEGE